MTNAADALKLIKRGAEEILLESHRLLEPHREARPDDWYWVNTHLAALYTGLGRDEDAARFRATVGG